MAGERGNLVKAKVDSVFQRNKGLVTRNKEQGNLVTNFSGSERWKSSFSRFDCFDMLLLASYKYAPLTSVDVEHSLFRLKSILADNRLSFLFDNLCKHMVVQCIFLNEQIFRNLFNQTSLSNHLTYLCTDLQTLNQFVLGRN